MKILVTGAAGYIGGHVSNYLLNNTSHDLVLIDLHSRTGPAGAEIRKLDISDSGPLDQVFKSERFDAVIHLAALVDAQLSITEPLSFYASNVSNTISLLQMCSKYSVSRFVFPSSAAVYEPTDSGLLNECSPMRPLNPYGRSKVMCEDLLKDTSEADQNLRYVVLRPFMIIGGGGSPELDAKAYANGHPIKIAAQAALGIRKKMVIFGDQYNTPDGTCVRDFVHIDDVCRMVSASLDYLHQDNASEVFNCGSSKGYSLTELVNTMKNVSGVDFEVEIGEKRPHEYPSMVADISRAQDLLGWQPCHNRLEDFCQVTLDLAKRMF